MTRRFEIRPDYLKFHAYTLGPEEEREAIDALRSGWITRGPKTAAFEKKLAAFLGVPHALALNSCTAGLHVALLAAGVGPGDEVITTPLTFAATANVCEHVGARPVFVDVRESDLTLDMGRVERAVTRRTRAVIPVHYGGFMADMEALAPIAERHGLVVIEDAAHALEGEIAGRRSGCHGDFAAFSFYATKNVTCGEGGALATNNPDFHARAQVASLHGMSKDAWGRYERGASAAYDIVLPGFKYNMFDLQAALLLHQMDRIETFRARRDALVGRYRSLLSGHPSVRLLSPAQGTRPANHLFPAILDFKRHGLTRDRFTRAMDALNVGVSLHFIPLHLMSYYRDKYGYLSDDFPNALSAYEGLVSLPLYPAMKDGDVDYVVAALAHVLETRGGEGEA